MRREKGRDMTQTIILYGPPERAAAHNLIDRAPSGAVMTIREAKRTTEQNDKMWSMISDISRAKPDGRMHTPEVWKALFMKACGHAVQFEHGLDGEPFPIGFRSSKLTKQQMSDLIESIYAYGAEKGVIWTEPERAAA
jgi:hypothetical protein